MALILTYTSATSSSCFIFDRYARIQRGSKSSFLLTGMGIFWLGLHALRLCNLDFGGLYAS